MTAMPSDIKVRQGDAKVPHLHHHLASLISTATVLAGHTPRVTKIPSVDLSHFPHSFHLHLLESMKMAVTKVRSSHMTLSIFSNFTSRGCSLFPSKFLYLFALCHTPAFLLIGQVVIPTFPFPFPKRPLDLASPPTQNIASK